MVQFKSWKDYYIFLRDYGVFTCLNCHYGGNKLSDDEEHSNQDYAYVFCIHHIAMVRLDMQTFCINWADSKTGKELKDLGLDTSQWSIPDEIIDLLDEPDKEWSIDEVREAIENEEPNE